jgi:hypothetical protein
MHARAILVAAHAYLVVFVRRISILECAYMQRTAVIQPPDHLDMAGTRTMTGLTTSGFFIVTGIEREDPAVFTGKIAAILVFMAGLAFALADILRGLFTRLGQGVESMQGKQEGKQPSD